MDEPSADWEWGVQIEWGTSRDVAPSRLGINFLAKI